MLHLSVRFIAYIYAFLVAGCVTVPDLPAVGPDHPANPRAVEAPVPARLSVIDLGAATLETQPQPADDESTEPDNDHQHHDGGH